MFRRLNFNLICFAFGFGCIFVLLGTKYTDNNKNFYTTSKNQIEDSENVQVKLQRTQDNFDVETMINKTRTKIKSELSDYNFMNAGVTGLEDLLMESGGTPLRSLIVTTWRSGSTFFGELLDATPGNYYHYEPFFWYGIKQIRGPPDSIKALKYMEKLMKCDYNGLDEYFEFGKKHEFPVSHTSKLWEHCKTEKELCFNPGFTSKICKLFPFQSMKVVRVRLKLIKQLLEDELLNLRVILLVRDPRGVMQSRQHRSFCQPAPDCWWPELVCADMVSDYVAASRLMIEYPDRIMTLRYEALALDPNRTAYEVLKFLRLDVTKSVKEFLRTHTSVNVAGFDSTFRISRDIPFKWRTGLYFDYVDEVQTACKEAMSLWGYKMAYNETQMQSKEFYPMEPYTITNRLGNQ